MSGLVPSAVQQRLTIGVAGVPALLSAGLDGEAICARRIAASACSLPCEPVVRASPRQRRRTMDQAPPTILDTSIVIELRQYRLHPGKRNALIDFFEQSLVEPQEAAGMRVLGQFRDKDDADRLVWLRGFRDMPSRAEALQSFYGGPVWKAHRSAANANDDRLG